MSSALALKQSTVTLDIGTLSSNLIHVTTVTNYNFIKKKIREFDFKGLSSLLEESLEDHFFITDLYKIYLSCVQRVLMTTPNLSDSNLYKNQFDFFGCM